MDKLDRPLYSLPASQMAVRLPRVMNKSPAEIQITSEQLLREAQANQTDDLRPPRTQINDEDELKEYLQKKRAECENNIRKQRSHVNHYTKYAAFEEGLGDFKRARSVFERGIIADYSSPTIWLKYAEMEMRHKFVNHARNIWERAVHYLPRVDQLWYKYAYMEEMLGNYKAARDIFERWTSTYPSDSAWTLYCKFEERMGEVENARKVMQRFLTSIPKLQTFLKVAKFEEKHKNRPTARGIYEAAVSELGPDAAHESLFLEFIHFEIRCGEIERARVLYRYAVDHLPKSKAPKLHQGYVTFEKQHGSCDNIEAIVLNKRRALYEQQVQETPMNYDAWMDYIKLEEAAGTRDKVRDLYERALSNLPPATEKRYWRRYMFFWYNYAAFEEIVAQDLGRTQAIYEKALETVPHKLFSFSKLWRYYALFEVRRLNLDKARKILGTAIAKCGRQSIFRAYIDMELQLGNVDRARKLYEKFIETNPQNCSAWINYAKLEQSLEEMERCRGIYELAISQNVLDMPELVWKAYIDSEIEQGNTGKVRELYDRLLIKTKHLKVWLSYAQFEVSVEAVDTARELYAKADQYFKANEEKEARLLLLEAWLEMEQTHGSETDVENVKGKMPRKVKRQRRIRQVNEEGESIEGGWEEYLDYQFPDEDDQLKNSKLRQFAEAWKASTLSTN